MELGPRNCVQTEVGSIPEDWRTESVANLVEPASPVCYGVVQVGQHTENGVPIVAIKFVKEIAHAPLHRTSPKLEKPYLRSRVRRGDVLISIKGTIGRVGVVPEGFEGNISREVARLRIGVNTCSEFIAHQLEAGGTQERIMRSVVGTTRLEFSIAALREFRLAIPPTKGEQRAIAAVLSDVDALQGTLERLIAKKRDLKQAAMQQLLTGETRLAGFSAKWEKKQLGDHVSFLRNGSNSRAELTSSGTVKYLHYGDIHGCSEVRLNPAACMMPHLSQLKAAGLDRLRDGDVIFADASEDLGGVGKSVEIFGTAGLEVVSGLHTIAARFDRGVLADGFKGYLQFCQPFRQQLNRLAAGTKVYAITRGHIASIQMELPEVKEQIAIATILSDMDAELVALEQRLAKTRTLKQGMMQELLTGRTRLT